MAENPDRENSTDESRTQVQYPERWSWETLARKQSAALIEFRLGDVYDSVRRLKHKLRDGEEITVEEIWHVKEELGMLEYRLDQLTHVATREYPEQAADNE